MSDDGFKLECALICDDIRTEDNGKAILIGVYSGDIIVPRVPVTLGLSVWLQGRAKEAAAGIGFRVEIASDSSTTTRDGVPPPRQCSLNEGDTFLISFARSPIQIVGAGHVAVKIKFGEKDWAEVLRKNVTVGDFAATEQSPPGFPR